MYTNISMSISYMTLQLFQYHLKLVNRDMSRFDLMPHTHYTSIYIKNILFNTMFLKLCSVEPLGVPRKTLQGSAKLVVFFKNVDT